MVRGAAAARPRIFVQIASYRDPECQWTIRDLFDKARHPERVSVGVCWQFIAQEDAHCFEVQTRPERVRVDAVDARESRGLCWARRHTQRLWEGEEYTLQIDSHMRFVPAWDEKLIEMISRCPSAKPVLTTYPPAYTPPNELSDPVLTRIHAGSFRPDGTLSLEPRLVAPDAFGGAPIPSAFCAGGFMFAPAAIITEVPYDPDIYFSGEEVLFSARAWTGGWDFYAPDEVTVFHYYGAREGSGRHWTDHEHWYAAHQRSNLRLRWVLGMDEETDATALGGVGRRYGLGGTRSLEDYEAFSGVDFRRRSVLRIPQSYGVGLPREPVSLAAKSRLLILGDGGIVMSGSGLEVHRLNTMATYGWCVFEEHNDPRVLARRLAETFRLPAETAENYAVNLLDEWARLGLLSGSIETGGAPRGWSEPHIAELPDPRAAPERLEISASALGDGQACVLIPITGAPWVNLALLSEGLRAGFDCVAADRARLDGASSGLIGFEGPVCVDAAGAEFLAQTYPDCFEPAARSATDRKTALSARAPSSGSAPVAVRRVVFPTYQPGADTRLKRLAPEEALARLLGLTMTDGGRLELDTVESLIALLRECGAYELSFSAFDEAARCAFDALAPPRRPTREVSRRIVIAAPHDAAY